MNESTETTAVTVIDPARKQLARSIYESPKRYAHICNVGVAFAKSTLVPKEFKNNPANCTIAVSLALRLGVDPLTLMQNLSIVNGKPGIDAKLLIALINDSGLFTGPLEFEVVGSDPRKPDYKVRAFARFKATGQVVYGPWIDWQMVKGEGWLDKSGSKWKTMPELMFTYRAATFFSRVHCPQVSLTGMYTADEIEDFSDGVAVVDYPQDLPRLDVTPEQSQTPKTEPIDGVDNF